MVFIGLKKEGTLPTTEKPQETESRQHCSNYISKRPSANPCHCTLENPAIPLTPTMTSRTLSTNDSASVLGSIFRSTIHETTFTFSLRIIKELVVSLE